MYLDQKVCLYSPPDGNLQPYNYSLPFAMQLPLHIPSSFIGTVGKIFYSVKANVHRGGISGRPGSKFCPGRDRAGMTLIPAGTGIDMKSRPGPGLASSRPGPGFFH